MPVAVEEFHADFEEALESVKEELGRTHELRIDGERVDTGEYFNVTSPGDQTLEIDDPPDSRPGRRDVKSNDSEYGFYAGLVSHDEDDIDRWFDEVESGMRYVNRSQSATTGALVQA